MTAPELALQALVFLVGACVGSFLNVCIARWPAGESVVSPRSRCPGCGHAIRWYENVPVLSWLLLRGRCAGCRGAISPQYAVVELLVGLGWLAALAAFGPTLTMVRVAVLGTLLLGVAVTDARHYLIPDGYTIFGLAWVLATAVAGAALGHETAFAGPADALLGACVGAGAISIIGWLADAYFKWRGVEKEAMGFGDVTLMAVVGAAVGPWRALLAVFAGAALAALVFPLLVLPLAWLRSRRAGTAFEVPQVPFGVFLAPAALLTLLWGTDLLDWYLGRFVA